MDAADRRWGATSTTNTASYGATWTTAEDRTRIALQLLHGPGPLSAPYRAEAWREMSSVQLVEPVTRRVGAELLQCSTSRATARRRCRGSAPARRTSGPRRA